MEDPLTPEAQDLLRPDEDLLIAEEADILPDDRNNHNNSFFPQRKNRSSSI